MQLAKTHLDVGLFARSIEPHLSFWTHTVGLRYDHRLKLGAGIHQHRFQLNGSVLKVNHAREPLAESNPSGIAGVRIATAHTSTPLQLSDPDANNVTLVPMGHDGVTGIGIDLRVNSRDAHERFWRHVMQFTSPAPDVYVCGDTRIFIREEDGVGRAQSWRGYGWRYLTVQITDCQAEHRGVLGRGGDEGEAPRRLGDVAIVSFVRDPDGNFIELSQRASLVGAL
jgi:predicted enzyme related to lactoylglutathione lyase